MYRKNLRQAETSENWMAHGTVVVSLGAAPPISPIVSCKSAAQTVCLALQQYDAERQT